MDEILRTLRSVPNQGIAYEVLIKTFIEPLHKSKKLSMITYNKVKDECDFLRKRKKKKDNGNQVENNQRGGGWSNPSPSHEQAGGQPMRQNMVSSDRYPTKEAHLATKPYMRVNYNQPLNQQPLRPNQVDSRASEDKYYNERRDRDSNIVDKLLIKLEKYKESNRLLRDDIERLNATLKNAYEDANDLRSRLSKLAGDKLKLNNPNITDLSDVYRPTNLGKHFSELYDNEWSDAFEEIDRQFKNERKSVDLLHDIVQNAFSSCERKAQVQEEKIRDILLDIEDDTDTDIQWKVENLHNILIEVRKDILPKSSVNVAKNYIKEEMSQHLSAYDIKHPGKKLKEFTQKCTELCWCMNMCDPPMSMVVDSQGQSFDKNVYKEYTTSVKDLKQPTVEYFVWPPLRLTVRGPLVSKGVAQPFEKKEKH